MWFLGHFALGYFSALFVSRVTKEKFSIPLACLVSISPDVDFFSPFIVHRGPTHSIIVAIVVFLPILLKYRRGYPYLASLASHSLIGDFLQPPVQLFWPIVPYWFGASPAFQLTGSTETLVEVSLFALMLIVAVRNWRKHT